MSQTEAATWADLAGAVHDDVITPLARRRGASGDGPYFPLAGDGSSSYFEAIDPTTTQIVRLETADDPLHLIEALAARWSTDGEDDLAAMAPRLRAVAEALAQLPDDDDGTVDVLCYTLF